jgi:hypothetical protein
MHRPISRTALSHTTKTDPSTVIPPRAVPKHPTLTAPTCKLAGVGLLALLLPQAAEAHSSAQLQGFGLPVLGDGERLLETLLGFHDVSTSALLPLQECSPEPMQLCCPPVPPALVC